MNRRGGSINEDCNPPNILKRYVRCIRENLRLKKVSKKKCTTKINFIRTNRIQGDDVNRGGKKC